MPADFEIYGRCISEAGKFFHFEALSKIESEMYFLYCYTVDWNGKFCSQTITMYYCFIIYRRQKKFFTFNITTTSRTKYDSFAIKVCSNSFFSSSFIIIVVRVVALYGKVKCVHPCIQGDWKMCVYFFFFISLLNSRLSRKCYKTAIAAVWIKLRVVWTQKAYFMFITPNTKARKKGEKRRKKKR